MVINYLFTNGQTYAGSIINIAVQPLKQPKDLIKTSTAGLYHVANVIATVAANSKKG